MGNKNKEFGRMFIALMFACIVTIFISPFLGTIIGFALGVLLFDTNKKRAKPQDG